MFSRNAKQRAAARSASLEYIAALPDPRQRALECQAVLVESNEFHEAIRMLRDVAVCEMPGSTRVVANTLGIARSTVASIRAKGCGDAEEVAV